jgi:hypothetical protein
MPNTIFMIDRNGALAPLDQRPFADEMSFQKLLEDYPQLISGDLIDSEKPRRWVVVKREIGVPDGMGRSTRWSLDHLFLDQDAIPTLVEVKRAENDEARRQVVGQILDYAANAVAYWPPDLIRTRFEDRARAAAKDPEQEIATSLGIAADAVEKFWSDVEENLRNKKIRMLVVADQIPQELKRIVEFLNEQMNPSTLLALELRHFAGAGIKTLVPVIFGQTEQAIQQKETRPRAPNASVSDLVNRIESALGAGIGDIVKAVVTWVEANDFHIRPTSKNLYFGTYNQDGDLVEPFSIDTDGKLWGQFGQLRPPFSSAERRLAVREKLSSVPGVEFSKAEQYPTSPINQLVPSSVDGFQAFLRWMREEVERRDEA